MLRAFAIGMAVVVSLGLAAPAEAGAIMDLRGMNVGMSATELPETGYRSFACAAGGDTSLAGWSEWKRCAPDASGLRALHVAYDEPGEDDTLIAGHPVTLTVFFDGDGHVARVLIETEAHARLYIRKKAYLLGQQAKFHYGKDGWECRALKPSARPGADRPDPDR